MRKFWLNKLRTKQAVLGSIALLLALDLSQALHHSNKIYNEEQEAYTKLVQQIRIENKTRTIGSRLPISEGPEKSIGVVLSRMYFFKPINYFLFGLSCKTCQGSWMAKYFPAYIDPVSSRFARERIADEQAIERQNKLDEIKYGSLWDRFMELLPFSISRSCTTLASKVISASESKAAEAGGVFTEYGGLQEVLKNNNAIVCKGMFKSKGDLPMGEYTISEDKNGIYWKYASGSFVNEVMQLPEVQALRSFEENQEE
jgi:hypothetical protein